MINKYFVSCYATSPSFYAWNPVDETNYFEQLQVNSAIAGIEHPFLINSNKYPLDWLLANIPDDWRILITLLPALMEGAKSNPSLGLASNNELDRLQAVSLMQQASKYVNTLNDAVGRQIVQAVHLHSSPKNEEQALRGNKSALQASLEEIRGFDWDGAQLNLEHCDAFIAGQVPDKGFLSLEDELQVLRAVGGFGLVLNWARSAIECRSTQGPLQHIKLASQSGLLKGFFFSGCGKNEHNPYGSWSDTHMPPKNFIKSDYLEPDSLLGDEEIRESLKLLNNIEYLGVKVLNPAKQPSLTQSVGLNLATIEALECVSSSIVEELIL